METDLKKIQIRYVRVRRLYSKDQFLTSGAPYCAADLCAWSNQHTRAHRVSMAIDRTILGATRTGGGWIVHISIRC